MYCKMSLGRPRGKMDWCRFKKRCQDDVRHEGRNKGLADERHETMSGFEHFVGRPRPQDLLNILNILNIKNVDKHTRII